MGGTAEGWKLVWRRGIAHVRFTWQKERHELSTGERDPRAATEKAGQIYGDVISGRWHPISAGYSALLIDLVPKWVKAISAELDERTVESYEDYSVGWFKFFGSTLGSIHKASAADYKRARLLKVSASSVRKELSALRGFLRWCVEQQVIEDAPLIAGVSKKAAGTRVREKRQRYTPPLAQLEVLFAAIPPRCRGGHLGRARFIIAYETGLRPATLDVLSVPKHYVKGATHLQIPDEDDKARFGRPLPLSPRARAVLDEVAPPEGVIFGAHDYRGVWKLALKAAGLPEKMIPYDLRHSRIQHLVDAGQPLTGVAHLAGHTLLTTTNEYLGGSQSLAEAAVAGVTTGVAPLEWTSAKEGSRTPTRVTPPEPERVGKAVFAGNSRSRHRQVDPQNNVRGLVTGVRPQSMEPLSRAQFHEATSNLLGLLAGVA